MTCSEYAAIVFRSGVLRSMSRSGGVEAHSHVGEGHVATVGTEDWSLVGAKENGRCLVRREPVVDMGMRERRAVLNDMMWW
jgi:hypothetical protein